MLLVRRFHRRYWLLGGAGPVLFIEDNEGASAAAAAGGAGAAGGGEAGADGLPGPGGPCGCVGLLSSREELDAIMQGLNRRGPRWVLAQHAC